MEKIRKALENATDTRAVLIEEGAVAQVPAFLRRLGGEQVRAVLIADMNTWKAAGAQVSACLAAAGIPQEQPLVFDDPDLYAEWRFLKDVEIHLRAHDAFPVAVGSGVINDLVKLASSRLGRPYLIVGTAVSMDGYTAFGASITFEGIKQTFSCKAPAAVVLDPAIAAAAPVGLAASGYADLFAKIPAGSEWMLADALGEEPIHPTAFHLVQDGLREALSDPAGVADGALGPTRLLAEGLIMSGLAMQACQSSRPASGTEHQISHFWDMEGLSMNGRHVSHGFKVAIGTLVSTACLEFMLGYDWDRLDIDAAAAAWPSFDEQQALIRKLFADRPFHRERALSESARKYHDAAFIRTELERFRAVWPALSEEVRKQILPFGQVREALRLAGAPYEPEMIGISRQRLCETFQGLPYMRSRFLAIDFLLRAGLMKEVSTHLFGPGGHWDLSAAPAPATA